MRKILIIGCPGAGKSTLARTLGEKLHLKVVYLDQLWHRAGWTTATREEFDDRLRKELEDEKWIIDGNYSRTMPMRLAKCDTVIYLDFDRFTCLWGMFRRVVRNYGKVRADMAPGCPERFDWEFIKYIWTYNRCNRLQNQTLLAQAKHAKVITLKNRKQVKAFLRNLPEPKSE